MTISRVVLTVQLRSGRQQSAAQRPVCVVFYVDIGTMSAGHLVVSPVRNICGADAGLERHSSTVRLLVCLACRVILCFENKLGFVLRGSHAQSITVFVINESVWYIKN